MCLLLDLFRVDPLHHLAQAATGLFDLQIGFGLARLGHRLLAALAFGAEDRGEGTVMAGTPPPLRYSLRTV
jgi:hypothetical protein